MGGGDMSQNIVVHPRKGHDLEADLREAFERTQEPTLYVPLGQKLFDASKAWRVHGLDGSEPFRFDGYDIEMRELTGVDKRVVLRMLGWS